MDIRRSGSQPQPADQWAQGSNVTPQRCTRPPTTAMTHIAVVEQLDGRAVDWMEKVSDEQCQGRKANE